MVFKVINDATSWNGDLYWEIYDYGAGNDTIKIEADAPFTLTIKTYGGKDFVFTDGVVTSSYDFATYYLGSGNDTLAGSNSNDTFIDQSGHDTATLGAGDDWVLAGKGNDTVHGGDGVDSLFFGYLYDAMGNRAANTQGIRFDLGNTGKQDLGVFGTDRYRSFENVSGGLGNDTLFGSEGTNELGGGSGRDYLRGRGGSDSIFGGYGRDTLIGDGGADALYGGFEDEMFDAARDTFKFYGVSDSRADAMDMIFGFESAAAAGGRRNDVIDLSLIDANVSSAGNNAFAFIGDKQFGRKTGEVRVVEFGGSTVVFVDNDADSDAEMVFMVMNVTGLTRADFIL